MKEKNIFICPKCGGGFYKRFVFFFCHHINGSKKDVDCCLADNKSGLFSIEDAEKSINEMKNK